MKFRNIIYIVILIPVTLASLWVLPALVRKATYTPPKYPFVYYSEILEGFGFIDYPNKEFPMTDAGGNIYSAKQFDSLMPLLNYRQLMSDNRMPDSLEGYELTPQLLRSTSVVFKYNPRTVFSPDPGLYILFESMPKRLGLEIPPDVMRLGRDVEFIDAETNSVDRDKSELFRQAFDKAGFVFPAQWASGNPSPRKAYDEGYFSLDSSGALFHIKMVNGRPYVRDTGVGKGIDILSFSMYESANKRFYGFIVDRQGLMYILESDEQGGYDPLLLDMDPIDPYHETVSLMGNLLYWMITIAGRDGCRYYALDTPTLRRVDTARIGRTRDRWDKVSGWLFPYYLTFEHPDTSFITPRFTFTHTHAFIFNLLCAVAVWLLAAGGAKRKSAMSLYVLATGLAGLAALLVIPGFRSER